VTTTVRVSCSHCGAPLEVASVGAPISCTYCGVQNHLSYDFKNNALVLLKHQVDHHRIREDLEKRIDILLSNLGSVDPGAQWPEGGPSLSPRAAMTPAGILAVLGLVMLIFTEFGYLLIVAGVVLTFVRLSRLLSLRQAYEQDRTVSQRNAALITKLRRELTDYQAVRTKLGGGN
jgi:hypothetical protein